MRERLRDVAAQSGLAAHIRLEKGVRRRQVAQRTGARHACHWPRQRTYGARAQPRRPFLFALTRNEF